MNHISSLLYFINQHFDTLPKSYYWVSSLSSLSQNKIMPMKAQIKVIGGSVLIYKPITYGLNLHISNIWNHYVSLSAKLSTRWHKQFEEKRKCCLGTIWILWILKLKQWAAYWDFRCVIHIGELNSWVGNKHSHYYFKKNCYSNTSWRSC